MRLMLPGDWGIRSIIFRASVNSLSGCQQHIDFTAGKASDFSKRFLCYIPFKRVGSLPQAVAVPEDFRDGFMCS